MRGSDYKCRFGSLFWVTCDHHLLQFYHWWVAPLVWVWEGLWCTLSSSSQGCAKGIPVIQSDGPNPVHSIGRLFLLCLRMSATWLES